MAVFFPSLIPTASLKLEDVPSPEAKWEKLAVFALTFEPSETGDYGEKAADLSNVSSNSRLVELRAHLYVEQRRWNHYNEEPDAEAMNRLREIVGFIRQELARLN